jgi:hypothetical protein
MLIVDTLYDDALERFVEMREGVKIARDPNDPEEETFFYTPEDDYLLVLVSPEADAKAVETDLRRQMRTSVRIVDVVDVGD